MLKGTAIIIVLIIKESYFCFSKDVLQPSKLENKILSSFSVHV